MTRRAWLLGVLALVALPPLAEAADHGPRLVAEPESFDFGEVLQRKTLEKDFVLRNLGDREALIEKVSTTCGCTVAEGYGKLIAPGETTPFRVKLQTRDSRGRIEKRVLVRIKDGAKPLEIRLRATVVAAP